jgi:hypothetical protein
MIKVLSILKQKYYIRFLGLMYRYLGHDRFFYFRSSFRGWLLYLIGATGWIVFSSSFE